MSYYAKLPLNELIDLIEEHPVEVELRLAMAEQHVRYHEFEEALSQVELAHALTSDDPHVQAWLAMCQLATGQVMEGHDLLKRVIRKYPCREFQTTLMTEIAPLFSNSISIPLETCWQARMNSCEQDLPAAFLDCCASFAETIGVFNISPAQSIPDLEKHLAYWSEDIHARLFLAKAYRFMQRKGEAELHYRIVIDADPEATVAMFDLATIIDDPWEAIELTRRGLGFCRFDNRARCKLAALLHSVGHDEQARQELSRVPADSPFYADAMAQMGQSWESAGELEQAVQWLARATLRCPGRGEIRGKYGQLLCDLARFDEALNELESAARLEPQQFIHWANIGLLHQHLGRSEQAFIAFRKSRAIDPTSSHVAINLSLLLAESGEVQSGIQLLEDMLEVAPDDFKVCEILAGFHLGLEDIQQALFYSEKSIRLGNDAASIYFNLAAVFAVLGNRSRCLQNLRKALHRNPEFRDRFRCEPEFREYWEDAEFSAIGVRPK